MCNCGSNKHYSVCCEPLLKGITRAQSAETLMRSRYTAFSIHNMDYLLSTTDPQTRNLFDLKTNSAWAQSVKFIKLNILNSSEERNNGFVEFEAHYQSKDGKIHIHRERSKFRRIEGVWYYKEGKIV